MYSSRYLRRIEEEAKQKAVVRADLLWKELLESFLYPALEIFYPDGESGRCKMIGVCVLVESPREIFPRGAHGTVLERLRSYGSSHPISLNGLDPKTSSCFQLCLCLKPNSTSPSLQSHYRAFIERTWKVQKKGKW
jgi:hypothetical protein